MQLEMARTESFVASNDERKLKEAHLVNLNEDLLLSGVVFHFLSKAETTVGRKDAKTPPDICLNGLRSVNGPYLLDNLMIKLRLPVVLYVSFAVGS